MRFDIDDYRQRADRLRWDDLDLTAFAADPLDDESLRAIEYMHESSTTRSATCGTSS